MPHIEDCCCKKLGPSFEYSILVFDVCKHHCEETLLPKVKIDAALGFPVIFDPGFQSFLSGPYSHEFSYDGVCFHMFPVLLKCQII